jgi:hypothetical protein
MSQWPHDDPASLAAFYGNPNTGAPGKQLVPVVPPFKMYYDGKPIAHIMFHKKAALALTAALNAIWEHYDCNQAAIDKAGISRYSGAYNPRKIRGSATRWSNHAYGAAIDFDAEHNGFNTGHGKMPQAVVDAFKAQGALWGGDYHGRTDPMHFEFCSRGAQPAAFMPQADADTDENRPETDSNGVDTDNPNVAANEIGDANAAWYVKLWSWISGGGIATLGVGGSLLSGVTPQVVLIVLAFALIVFLVVWFTKKGRGW